jgi:hypothetical protein
MEVSFFHSSGVNFMTTFMTMEGPVTLVNTCSEQEEAELDPLPHPGVVPPVLWLGHEPLPLPPCPAVGSAE